MAEEDRSRAALRELHAVLDRLVRRLTRRAVGTPREMQMDAARAITLLNEVRIPNREYLASNLTAVIRELGQRRPDLHRYVVYLETAAVQVEAALQRAPDAEEEPGA